MTFVPQRGPGAATGPRRGHGGGTPAAPSPIEIALKEAAAAAARGEVPVGAVVTAEDGTVIARAGKPLVKVMRLEAEPPRRLGFLQGQFNVPEDFDRMAADDIQTLFEGGADA